MKLIAKNATHEIWYSEAGDEYAVYGCYKSGDPRWCPSRAMAFEVAGL